MNPETTRTPKTEELSFDIGEHSPEYKPDGLYVYASQYRQLERDTGFLRTYNRELNAECVRLGECLKRLAGVYESLLFEHCDAEPQDIERDPILTEAKELCRNYK